MCIYTYIDIYVCVSFNAFILEEESYNDLLDFLSYQSNECRWDLEFTAKFEGFEGDDLVATACASHESAIPKTYVA